MLRCGTPKRLRRAMRRQRARAVEEQQPEPRLRVNLTEPQSRLMPARKGWLQGYNVQVGVTADQLIVATQVSQHTNDSEDFIPMMAAVQKRRSCSSVMNLCTAPPVGKLSPRQMVNSPRGRWSTCHECHESGAVDDDLAGDQLSVPDDEMVSDLDVLAAVAGGVELEGLLAVVRLSEQSRDCLLRPAIRAGACEELLATLDVHHVAVEHEFFTHQLAKRLRAFAVGPRIVVGARHAGRVISRHRRSFPCVDSGSGTAVPHCTLAGTGLDLPQWADVDE